MFFSYSFCFYTTGVKYVKTFIQDCFTVLNKIYLDEDKLAYEPENIIKV